MNLKQAEKLGITGDVILAAIVADDEKMESEKTALSSTNTKLKEEKVKIQGKLKDFEVKFKGVDPDEFSTLKDKLSKMDTLLLANQGKADEAIKIASERLEEKHLSEMETRDSQISKLLEGIDQSKALNDTLTSSLVDNVRGGGLSTAFLALKADPRILQTAKIQAGGMVAVDTDDGIKLKPIIEVDNAGNSLFRDPQSGERLKDKYGKFDYKQYVEYIAEKDYLPVFSDPSGGNFLGGGAVPKNLKRADMSIDDKLNFQEKHGEAALLALPK